MPDTPVLAAKEAARYAERGYRRIKFGWGPIGQDLAFNESLVREIRRAAGDDVTIMIDAGQVWDTKTALRMASMLEGYAIGWLEEPVAPDNLTGYRALSERSSLTIAGGEAESDYAAFERLIDDGGVDLIQPDLARCGGLTQGRRLAWLAHQRHRRVVPHAFKSGVLVAASTHFAAAIPNGGSDRAHRVDLADRPRSRPAGDRLRRRPGPGAAGPARPGDRGRPRRAGAAACRLSGSPTPRISTEWSLAGQPAVVLENRRLRAVVLPGLGGKIISLVDKAADVELLWRNERVPVRPVPFGSGYDDVFLGGWDELFPNDEPEVLAGEAMPDHGELWSLPWLITDLTAGDDEVALELTVRPPISATRVTKRLVLGDGPGLRTDYRVTNEGRRELPFLWKSHVAVRLHPDTVIALAAGDVLVHEFGDPRARPEGGRFTWPSAVVGGRRARLPPPARHQRPGRDRVPDRHLARRGSLRRGPPRRRHRTRA